LGGRNGIEVSALVAAIAADPWVQAASPRVYGYGLVSATHQSAGAQLLGVIPDQEQKITVLQTRMVKGSYLTARTPKGVVMGDKLATTIGVEVGSEIVVLTPAADGSTGNDLYTVTGMFHTGLDDLDRGLVLMPLASLQELLRLPPGRIHEVGIKLHDITTATTTAAALEVQLSKTLPVRVRAWPELAPELADYVQFNRRVTFILFFIFFLLAVMGIVNTMLMAVIERTRELGMLMAVGMRPVQVVGLIVAEAASLAGASLILGAALGAPLLWYLQAHGLNLGGDHRGAVSLAGVVVGPLWYGRQDFTTYAQAALGLAITALVSALYPALRAARFRPTEALRKI
jgi:ABC-type lipoprotein release transport system permease subunit